MTQEFSRTDNLHENLSFPVRRGRRKTPDRGRSVGRRRLGGLYCLMILALLASSGRVTAQDSLVIDINVVGLSVNQSTAISQINEACAALIGNTTPTAVSLLALCAELSELDPNDAVDIVRIQQVASAVAVEEAFVINDALVTLSDYQTTNVRARLDALRHAPVVQAVNLHSAESEGFDTRLSDRSVPSGGAASSDLTSRLGGFINGHVSSGSMDGGTLQQDTDISSSSMTLGADYRFNDNVVAGVGAGFLQDENTFTSAEGGAESDGFNLTAFASWYESDLGYLDVVLDVGKTDFELRRSITIVPTVPLTARSSPTSNVTTFTVSGGRNFRPYGWDLGGYFRLAHTRATIDSYTETLQEEQTGFAAVFSIAEQSIVSTRMVFGLELSGAISTQRAILVPSLRLEYVNENERDKEPVEATLTATGTVATYQGEERVSSYSNLGIGASAVFPGGRNLYAYYETHLQHDVVSQDWLKVGVRLEF